MSGDSERTFHLERAEQSRKMAADASDRSIRQLHEQLAEFHEAEARRVLTDVETPNEDAL